MASRPYKIRNMRTIWHHLFGDIELQMTPFESPLPLPSLFFIESLYRIQKLRCFRQVCKSGGSTGRVANVNHTCSSLSLLQYSRHHRGAHGNAAAVFPLEQKTDLARPVENRASSLCYAMTYLDLLRTRLPPAAFVP
jgi:hypothetical protein